MSKLLGPLAKTLFAIFMLAVVAGVMLYTWQALTWLFPGNLAGMIFGMVLFDIAAIVWFLVFVSNCNSTMQYVFAAIGFLIALIGTLSMVAIEVGISSGVIEARSVAQQMTYIFDVVITAHLVLLYAHHASAPEISADISLGVERARISDDAQKQAERLLMDNQQLLAAPIAAEHVRRVIHDLNLRPREGEVLDLQALDVVPGTTEPKKPGMIDFLFSRLSGLGKGARKFESNVPSVATTSQPLTPKPSPVATDAGSEEAEGSKVNA